MNVVQELDKLIEDNIVQEIPQKNKGGRPPKNVNFGELAQLCKFGHTLRECASVLNMDEDTINARLKEEFDCTFKIFQSRYKGHIEMSLRRKQYAQALNGNTTMLIWLGKNVLGQKDKTEFAFDPESAGFPELHVHINSSKRE